MGNQETRFALAPWKNRSAWLEGKWAGSRACAPNVKNRYQKWVLKHVDGNYYHLRADNHPQPGLAATNDLASVELTKNWKKFPAENYAWSLEVEGRTTYVGSTEVTSMGGKDVSLAWDNVAGKSFKVALWNRARGTYLHVNKQGVACLSQTPTYWEMIAVDRNLSSGDVALLVSTAPLVVGPLALIAA